MILRSLHISSLTSSDHRLSKEILSSVCVCVCVCHTAHIQLCGLQRISLNSTRKIFSLKIFLCLASVTVYLSGTIASWNLLVGHDTDFCVICHSLTSQGPKAVTSYVIGGVKPLSTSQFLVQDHCTAS